MPFADESGPVRLVAYRPEWREEFAVLAAKLGGALGDLAVAIDHVGSTSVPGLPAKDCVDVQVRVRELDEGRALAALTPLGLRQRPEEWNRVEVSSGRECRKMVFAPPAGAPRAYNVHLREHDGPNARLALLFRDHLRADADVRAAWGAFKTRLSAQVPDLMTYGQIKAPAWTILMTAAEHWATATGWHVPWPTSGYGPPPPSR